MGRRVRGVLIFATSLGLSACAAFSDLGGVRIISPYGSFFGAEGYPRPEGPHTGVDVAGPVGTPVIAAADGEVTSMQDMGDCGNAITIWHREFDHYTAYCHLSPAYEVQSGQPVKRGQVIGSIGNTGRRAGPGFEHVHLSLRGAGRLKDPMSMTVGCFDPKKVYPTDRLVLTFPVRCEPAGGSR